jgi:glycosyltransferase involved in cell wall biosynthesis
VGRLIPQKNYERLIQAFSTVVDAEPGAKLVLVGDGKKRPQLSELVQELELSDHIIFLGEVSRDQVYALLHEFDIFVIPSLWEGFCNAAVEAMAAGLPLVCSDIQTLHEVVGDVALYVDPESPDNIAQGLLDLLQEDPVQWRERGKACRKRAVERYSIERTAKAYVRNYFIAAGQSEPKELEVA